MPLTKVSAGVIAANAVVESVGSQSITGDKLGLTAINANNIVGGSITGAKLAANTVSGDVIGQNAISSNNIVSVNASVATVGTLPTARLPANSVLQVVSVNNTLNLTATTSGSFVSLGQTASITPLRTSSKILIMACFSGTQDGGSNDQAYFTVFRDASVDLKTASYNAMYDHPGGNVGFSFNIICFDSPSTTSPTTYTVYAKVDGGSQFRPRANTDTIVLMEIAG
jgi:hypothetical protein